MNSAYPDALAIARIVARHLGHHWDEVLLDDDADPRPGSHPWNRRPPVVLDTTAATELGYKLAGDYAATVAEDIDWLVSAAPTGDPARVLPAPNDPSYARYPDLAEDSRTRPDPQSGLRRAVPARRLARCPLGREPVGRVVRDRTAVGLSVVLDALGSCWRD